MTCNIPAQPFGRKLEVSQKPIDCYNEKRQWRGFTVSEKLSRIITTRVWSPAIFKGGIRAERNFIKSDWAAFDFDEHIDISQIAKELIDFVYIIAPTKSHTENHHRFRVCIPWSRPITDIMEYRHNIARLIKEFGADKQCKDAARFFWPSKFIYAVNLQGDCLDVEAAPRYRIFEPVKLIRPTEAVFPDRVARIFERGVIEGTRNKTIWGVARDLYKSGFDWQTIRILVDKIPCQPKVSDRELDAIIRSAQKSIQAQEGASG